MAERHIGGGTTVVPESTPDGNRPNPWGWIAGIVVDPGNTLTQIAGNVAVKDPANPDKTRDHTKWWLPVTLAAVIAIVISLYIVPNIVMPMQAEAIRASVVERGGSPEDAEMALSMAAKFALPSAVVGAAIQTFVMLFVIAGIFHLLFRMVGGKGSFRNARAAVGYGMIIGTIGSLVKLPIMITKETMFVELGPTLFLPHLEPSHKLYKFLFTGFDLFSIWWLVVLIIGLAIGYRVSKGKAATVIVLAWLAMSALIAMLPGGGFGVSG